MQSCPFVGFSLWAIAAQYNIALWTERVPTQEYPADVPSRAGQLSFDTELRGDMAPPKELSAICDFAWAPPQPAA